MKYFAIFALFVIFAGVNADLRDTLVHRAESILKTAQDTLDDLAKNNRKLEGAAIEKDVELLKKTVADLKAATSTTDITHLDHEVMNIERRLISEIRRVHTAPTNHVRERLLARAEALTKAVDEAIKDLTAQQKTEDVKKFQEEETKLKAVAEQVKKETEHNKLVHLEVQLVEIEGAITRHLRAIHHQVATSTAAPFRVRRDAKDDAKKAKVLARAEVLIKNAEVAVKELTANNQKHEAAQLEKDESALKKLVDELKTATEHAQMEKIEHEVTAAEGRILAELRRLHSHTHAPHHTHAPTTPAF